MVTFYKFERKNNKSNFSNFFERYLFLFQSLIIEKNLSKICLSFFHIFCEKIRDKISMPLILFFAGVIAKKSYLIENKNMTEKID